MDTTVTLKLSPSEYDLIRAALYVYAEREKDVQTKATYPTADRRRARESEARARDALAKLNA